MTCFCVGGPNCCMRRRCGYWWGWPYAYNTPPPPIWIPREPRRLRPLVNPWDVDRAIGRARRALD